MSFLSAIVLISLAIYSCNTLTINQICNPKNKVDYFNVSSAFKVGNYVALVGDLKLSDQSAVRTTIRVMHYPFKQATNEYPYYQVGFWHEITEIDQKERITYAFSTRYMQLFKNSEQVNNELVYLVHKDNDTFVYDIDTHQPDVDTHPTFDVIHKLEVYNKEAWIERSGYLSLEFLLLHFPETVEVNNIMIYDITDPGNAYLHLYFALVYTTELYQGKEYYVRHKLRSEANVQRVHELKGEEADVTRLEWEFDQISNFCDKLDRLPNAVVFLGNEEWAPGANGLDDDDYEYSTSSSDIYFAEFYGNYHILMRISIKDTAKPYMDMMELAQSQHIYPNGTLRFCRPYPFPQQFNSKIQCADYANEDSARAQGSDADSYFDSSFWLLIGIIVTIILILLLIAFGVYFLVLRNKSIVNHESVEKNSKNVE